MAITKLGQQLRDRFMTEMKRMGWSEEALKRIDDLWERESKRVSKDTPEESGEEEKGKK